MINYAGRKNLVDPMLAPKDAYDSFTGKARNPMVELSLAVEALDHCHTTRASLRQKADELNIGADKLIIPADGETVIL